MPVESESSIGFLNSLEDPNSDNSLLWDKEHDNYILDKMIELVRAEFEKRDFDVFLRNAIEGQAAKELSKEFGISVGNIYKIKFRVLSRLKEAADGLLDVSMFADAPMNREHH